MRVSAKEFLNLHLDGIPHRKIAHQKSIAPMTSYRKSAGALKDLPRNNDFTRKYCNRFGGYLVFDGKYIAVKDYEKKIPLLWGVDFLTHDIPVYRLAIKENYVNCLEYFRILTSIDYPLKYLVCDDNEAIKMAASYVYPKAIIQSCLNHYQENMRRDLNVRSGKEYQNFMNRIENLFLKRLDFVSFTRELFDIYAEFKSDQKCVYWIEDIRRKEKELLAYNQFKDVPRTTNIIEAYNSHLQARLKAIKGFNSFHSADRWLNGYILRRRLKPFTDCNHKFKHLNGKCSLEKTLKRGLKLPNLF